MILTDTHIHWYLKDFDLDRDQAVKRAIDNGVERFFLPCIDSFSISQIIELAEKFPKNCFGMLGLHPCSVDKNFDEDLKEIEHWLTKQNAEKKTSKFYAIGEIGIDLYWDKTFVREQELAFKKQIQLAQNHELPIVIHMRNSFEIVIKTLKETLTNNLTGIFHCFSGSLEQAKQVIDLGFKLGIGGVVTFKNSNLYKVIESVDLKHIVLETDAPYLTPEPFRGKRNEGSNILYVAKKIAEIKQITIEEVAEITTHNSKEIFGV